MMRYDRSFAVAVGLNASFVVFEAVFGILSNSLALVADAGHNLDDVLTLLLAWGAVALSRRQTTAFRTYGWGRSTILAALTNAISLLIVVGAISWEAIRRLGQPSPVAEGAMIWVAGIGVLINLASALMFLRGRERDVNVRGAFIHLASDAGVSAGVIAAGATIAVTGWYWIDPAMGLLIGGVILVGTWGLLRDSLNLALDAVPAGVDAPGVRGYLASLPQVAEVHDLHIWAMSATETALTAHLVIPQATADDSMLVHIAEDLHNRFGIEHTTLQIERGIGAERCRLARVHG